MTTYYAKNEVEAFRRQLGNHKAEHDSWKETKKQDDERKDKEQKEYEKDHEDWLKLDTNEQGIRVNKDGLPVPEPTPPMEEAVPLEPTPPENKMTVYTVRELEEPEELQMAEGVALVMPPSVILSGGPNDFAITPDVLSAHYVSTETPIGEPVVPAKEMPPE